MKEGVKLYKMTIAMEKIDKERTTQLNLESMGIIGTPSKLGMELLTDFAHPKISSRSNSLVADLAGTLCLACSYDQHGTVIPYSCE